MKSKHYLIFTVLILVLASCATYYTKTQKFNEFVYTGNFEAALKWLDKDSKGKKGKNKVLHYLNDGYVNWITGNYTESNHSFNTADLLVEDQLKNYGLEALSLLTNPTIKPYKVEDFEAVMINFYKALNYLQLNDYESSIVECRRINIKLNQLNDKYKDHKNRYQQDAFAHNLMGLVYEADKNYNDAFIAYRNSYEVYKNSYTNNFNVKVPEQLKHDLLRSAYLTGFYDEVRKYEEEFNIKYKHTQYPNGELVFFWLNGFGPVKSEWSINFSKINGDGGWVTFYNEELDISFPFYVGNQSPSEANSFKDLRFLRVAFPKYVERKPVFHSAKIESGSTSYTFEIAQNINEIAFKTLRDRMIREMANSLLRLATKKAMEKVASEQNGNLGAIVSIANAVTEKADTRNWQTLPYTISYTRIPLQKGENNFKLKTYGNQINNSNDIIVQSNGNNLIFSYFHSLETNPLPQDLYY